MATERIDIVVSDNGSSRTVKRNIEDIGVASSKSGDAVGFLKNSLQGLGVQAAVAVASADTQVKKLVGSMLQGRGAADQLAKAAANAGDQAADAASEAKRNFDALQQALTRARSASDGLKRSATEAGNATGTASANARQHTDSLFVALNRARQAAEELRLSGQYDTDEGRQEAERLEAAITRAAKAADYLRGVARNADRSFNTASAQSEVRALENALEKATKATQKLDGALDKVDPVPARVPQSVNRIGDEARKAGGAVDFLRNVLFTLQIGLAVGALVTWADQWTNIENRLKLVATSAENLVGINEAVFEAAQRTRTPYDDMVNLFQQLTLQAERYALSQVEILALSETINQAAVLANTGNGSADQSIKQLIQGLARGRLEGEELNTIMGNTPRIATAIAEGLGLPLDVLKTMNKEGRLTGEMLVRGLQNAAPAIAEEFLRIKPTISGAFTVLNNGMIRLVGDLETSTGFATGFANAVIFLANNLEFLVPILVGIGGAMMLAFGPIAMRAMQAFFVALKAGIASNPLGLLAVAATTLITAIITLGDKWKVSADGVVSLRDVVMAVFSFIMDGLRWLGDTAVQIWEWITSDGAEKMNGFWGVVRGILGFMWNAWKSYANFMIGTFRFVFETIKILWRSLPAAIADAWVTAINWVISMFEGLVNRMIKGINDFLTGGRVALRALGIETGEFANITINRVDNANSGAMGNMLGDIGAARSQAYGTDYVGQVQGMLGGAVDAVMGRARTIAERDRGGALNDSAGAPRAPASSSSDGSGSDAAERADRQLTRAEMLAREMTKTRDALLVATNVAYDYTNRDAYTAVNDFNRQLMSKKDADGNPFAPMTEQEQADMLSQLLLLERAEELMRARDDVLRESIEPARQYGIQVEAINQLLSANRISAEDAAEATRDARIEFLRTREDAASGIELGWLEIARDNANEAGRAAEALRTEWDRANKPALELAATVGALNELLAQGAISAGLYAQRMREIELQGINDRIAAGTATIGDGMRGAVLDYANQFTGWIPAAKQAYGDFFSTVSAGFAESIGGAIVGAKDLGEALYSVAQNAVGALISALIEMGIQWTLQKALGVAFHTTTAAAGAAANAVQATSAIAATTATTTASVAAAGVTAAAWAPAAAAVSLGTAGGNAAPAGIGIATIFALIAGLIGGIALGGGFKKGGYTGDGATDQVMGVVHGREFVMNAAATSRWGRGMLEEMNAGRTPSTFRGSAADRMRGGAGSGGHGSDEGAPGSRRGGTQTPSQVNHFHFPVQDAKGIQQSKGQVQSALAKAAARGRRNM